MDMTVTADLNKIKSVFELNDNGDLLFSSSADEVIKVMPSPCFPWMKLDEFISIRNEKGNEVYLVKKLSDLDEVSFHAVSESLLAATFMMNIIEIKEIKEEFEIRSWNVVTTQGPYKFQTHIDYWPQVFKNNSVLIRDVTSNIFYIECPSLLDDNSQKLLWPFLD